MTILGMASPLGRYVVVVVVVIIIVIVIIVVVGSLFIAYMDFFGFYFWDLHGF